MKSNKHAMSVEKRLNKMLLEKLREAECSTKF